MKKHNRRQFILKSVPMAAGAGFGLERISAMPAYTQPGEEDKSMKIAVVGAHPDDPETMCGGTIALYSGSGHEVVAAYLTRGEAGIPGKSHEEAAAIRTGEAREACIILKARAAFLGQIDGNCEVNRQAYDEMLGFLVKESPDILITHWPIDSHRDHRVCSILVYDAWLRLEKRPLLYYGEVMSGVQSQNFQPTDYVNISEVLEQKHRACFEHKSQGIEESYEEHHGKMEKFRGMESGCEYAEAFIRHVKSPGKNTL